MGLQLSGCDQQVTNFIEASRRSRPGTGSQILSSPTSLSLVNPTSSPGTVATPTIRVSGVVSGNSVGLYYDSACQLLAATGTASSSTVDLTISSALADGVYNLYASTNNGSVSSSCSSSSLNYIVDNSTSVVSMAVRTKTVTEANTTTTVAVSISPTKPYDVTVGFNLTGTSASLGTQFQISGRTVTIPAGQSSANIPITILNDGAPTAETSIQLNLSSGSSNAVNIGYQNSTRISLIDSTLNVTGVSKLVTGDNLNCALLTNGIVKCWGDYPGDGSAAKEVPVIVDSGVAYTDIGVATDAACGVTTGGALKCWGPNTSGGAANGSTNPQATPFTVGAGFASVSMTSPSGFGGCAIKTDFSLYCWGTNLHGRIGNGNTTIQTSPVLIDAGTGYSYVKTAQNFTCGITTLGALKCWGINSAGQVGDTTMTANRQSPTLVDAGTQYSKVSFNGLSTCGITTTGVLKCWGTNGQGQLANGGTADNATPAEVDTGVNYSQIEVSSTVCGRTTTNVVKCWGANTSGTVGDGTTINRTSPVVIDAGTTYSLIQVSHSALVCGIVAVTGFVKCWGSAVGNEAVLNSTTPLLISSNEVFSKLGYSMDVFHAISTSGDVFLWGDYGNRPRAFGQGFNYTPKLMDPEARFTELTPRCRIDISGGLWCLGASESSLSSNTYTRIDPTETYSKVSTYLSNACGLTTSGKVKCWGDNLNGEVGNGTKVEQKTPYEVDAGFTHKAVAVGRLSSCLIRTSGALYCWGSPSTYHSVGNGSTSDTLTPVPIDSGTSYDSVSLDYHGCAITTTGVLKCWGYNQRGQVGNSSTTTQPTPTVINAGTSYLEVKAIDRHTCGITSTNALHCWGRNTNDEVGDGSGINRTAPVVVDSGVSYKHIGTGKYLHTCAITTGNVTKCWGSAGRGALGANTNSNPTPVAIAADPTLKHLTTGSEMSCGLNASGYLYCWGGAYFLSEYGLGFNSYSPVIRIPGLQTY